VLEEVGSTIFEDLNRAAAIEPPGFYKLDDGALTQIRPHSERRFAIRFADTNGQRNNANMLVQKMYSWRGYETDPGPKIYWNKPQGIVLVAADTNGTLGTLTLTLDSKQKLMADNTYPDEIQAIREQPNAFVCELGKLAVDQDRGSKWVLASLFHIVYIYGRLLNKVSDVFIEVNPRHALFYRRMLGFTVAGPERVCPRVNAPAVLLRLPLSYVDEQIEKYGGRSEFCDRTRSLYPYFFSKKEQEGLKNRILSLGEPEA
jgi:hypothetical protein